MDTTSFDEASVFNEARRIEEPEARRAFVRDACGGDVARADRIMALLRANDEDPSFLAPPGAPAEGPGARLGPYTLVRAIGQGGMGTVFLAEQSEPLRRQVAIKVIRPGMDSRRVLARFEAERQALALMDHPNIAKVFDAGTTPDGRPYFAMELIDGVPLTDFCDRARLSVRRRLELFVPVCQAVQHAHQKGVIHRDLKPSNVLVTTYDGRAVPKVIDFGIAKAIGPKLTERTLETQVDSVVGTLRYMSPEQAEPGQADVDTRSDIYSLGVMLYELLTGRTPLDPSRLGGVALLELLRTIRDSDPSRPSACLHDTDDLPAVAASRGLEPQRLVAAVRGDLDWIVMKCLERDRARRYETADALARDIERHLNLEPVEACPPSAGYRLRKFARRNRKLLLAASAFVLLLTTATAVSSWLAVRARNAERVADTERTQALAAKARADEQAEVAEAVNKFLNGDLLIQASAQESPDRDLKLRTVLDRASEKVDPRLSSQPLAAARVHKTLAAAYSSLGEPERAERHARRSYELYLSKVGAEDPLAVGAQVNLATSLFFRRKLEDAEKLYAEALGRARRVFPRDDPVTLATMSNLAAVYGLRGRLDDSRRLLEETLEVQRRVLGEEHRETLVTMSNLAGTYANLRRFDDAHRLFDRTIELQRRHLGPGDPHTLMCMQILADVTTFEGRHREAYDLRQEVLKQGSRTLPPQHPILLSARKESASLLWRLGRHGEAIRECEELLAFQVRTLKPRQPEVLDTLDALAWYLATAPDAKDRNPRRAIELAKELVDATPEHGPRWNTLGVAYYRADDATNAIAALEKSEELSRGQLLGPNGLFLAMAHWRLGRRDDARAWYDRAVGSMEKNRSSDPELLQFRAEAARLLGLPSPGAPAGKNAE
jgi:serine/threonine protein kinase/Flp pilus assembly protein TadD